jgi:hypothetical protein
MARILKRKRVPILSGDDDYDPENYVDIPVIAEMSIIGSRGQEFRYRFCNDSRSTFRTVAVKKIGNATGEFGPEVTVTTDSYVNAERILTSSYPNSVEMSDERGQPTLFNQAWGTEKKFKNSDPPPKQPDGSDDPHHLQVHYVRYYKNNDPDESLWIDVELIDMMELKATNGQDYTYRLRHPTSEEYADMAAAAGHEDAGKFGQPVENDTDDPYKPILGFCDPTLELLDVEFFEDA